MENHFKKIIPILVLSLFTTSSLMGQSSIFKNQNSYQTLSQTWELDPEINSETFLITSYKPIYVLGGYANKNCTLS